MNDSMKKVTMKIMTVSFKYQGFLFMLVVYNLTFSSNEYTITIYFDNIITLSLCL